MGAVRRGGIVAPRVTAVVVVRAGIFVGRAARRASVGVRQLAVWVRLPPVLLRLPFGGGLGPWECGSGLGLLGFWVFGSGCRSGGWVCIERVWFVCLDMGVAHWKLIVRS